MASVASSAPIHQMRSSSSKGTNRPMMRPASRGVATPIRISTTPATDASRNSRPSPCPHAALNTVPRVVTPRTCGDTDHA